MEPVKPQHRRNPVTAIGRWSTRHPWQAIAVWLAFVVAALGASALTGSKTLQSGTVGESARGYSMLEQTRPGRTHQFDYGYVHSGSLTAGDPAFRAAVSDVRSRMRAVLGTGVSLSVSRDAHSALLTADATQDFHGALQTPSRSPPSPTRG